MNRAMLVAIPLLAATAVRAAAQADTITAASGSLRLAPIDTVRVWSQKLKVKGARGVVARVDADSLAFIAPAGFRKIPREYAADVASIERVDVLVGRHRSFKSAGGKMLFGGVVGAVGGALIGTALGTVVYEANKARYESDEGNWDERGMLQFFGAVIFGTAGAAGGAIGGAIDGARSRETWRRVR